MNGDMPDNEHVAKFARYIGIDYSGAQTPRSSLLGLRVYMAEDDGLPIEVLPPPSPRKYWTQRGVAEWLVERLGEPAPTLSASTTASSFPLRYFRGPAARTQKGGLPRRFSAPFPKDAHPALAIGDISPTLTAVLPLPIAIQRSSEEVIGAAWHGSLDRRERGHVWDQSYIRRLSRKSVKCGGRE